MAYDLSARRNSGTIVGTPDWQRTQHGYGLRHDDDQYVTFSERPASQFTDQFTIFWFGAPVQLTADLRRFFVGQYEANDNDYDYGLYVGSAPYFVAFFVRNAATAAVNSVSTSTLSVGVPAVVCGRYDGANLSIWFNGVKEDEDAQTGNVQNSFDFKIGHTWGTGTYADVETRMLCVFPRALADAKIVRLSADPLYMIRPRRRTYFFPQVVGNPWWYYRMIGAA